jgi:hypothetical protein
VAFCKGILTMAQNTWAKKIILNILELIIAFFIGLIPFATVFPDLVYALRSCDHPPKGLESLTPHEIDTPEGKVRATFVCESTSKTWKSQAQFILSLNVLLLLVPVICIAIGQQGRPKLRITGRWLLFIAFFLVLFTRL